MLCWRAFSVPTGLRHHPPFHASELLFQNSLSISFFSGTCNIELMRLSFTGNERHTLFPHEFNWSGSICRWSTRCPHTSLLLLQKLLPELGSWVQKLETWDWIQKGRDKAFTMTSSSARWKTRLWPRANQAAVSAQNNGKGEAKTGSVGIPDLYVNKDSNLSSVPSWLVSVLLGSIAH